MQEIVKIGKSTFLMPISQLLLTKKLYTTIITIARPPKQPANPISYMHR